jgi:hypothetical protein
MSLCRNGLHEKTEPGRCRECRRANHAKYYDSESYRTKTARYAASEKGRAANAKRNAKYASSEKGKAKRAAYNASEKRRASNARSEESRIRVRLAGARYSYRVPPERKEELQLRLAGFRSQQADEYREHFAS